jgi:hypothetical protein
LLSTVLELNLHPSQADWDPSKLYVLVPMIRKSVQIGLPRNRPWDINWEVIKAVSRHPGWANLTTEKRPQKGSRESAGAVNRGGPKQQVWVAKAGGEGDDVTGPRPMTSSSGGSDSTTGGSRDGFVSRPDSPGDWAPIGGYHSYRGYENTGGGDNRGKPKRNRSPLGGRRQGSGRGGGNLTRTNSVPARFQGSPPPGMLMGAPSPHRRSQSGTPPLSPSGGLSSPVYPPPHLVAGPAAQYPIPLLQQQGGDPGMVQQMALQQMIAANNAALAALMNQQQVTGCWAET